MHDATDSDIDGGVHVAHEHGEVRRPGFKSAVRQLREDLKDGKVKKEDVQAQLTQLRATVGERQKEHRQELVERWGAKLSTPPAHDELTLHARRMAFLDRALLLAQSRTGADKDKLLERISKLVDKENLRHERALTLAVGPAIPTAASASPTPAVNAAAGGGQ